MPTNREILFIIKMRNEAQSALRSLNSDFGKTAGAAATANKNLGSARGELTRFTSAGGASAAVFTRLRGILVGLGLGLGLGAAVRTVADFGQAMSTVQAITQATDEQFKELRDSAKNLGATTRFTATQAAEGMLFLARAGFDTNEVLATIPATLDLAQAGALDLGRAADIASNVLQGFRLQASESARVVDVLALAANSSNTNVEQLGDALKFVAPVASGVGVSLEETVAALGALADAGLQASSGGTGLRRVISELESPSTKTTQILQLLGLTADDVRISQVGLTAAVKALGDAGLDTGLALEVFGDRGGPAFEVFSSSIQKVEGSTRSLGKAGGTAREVSKIMDENLNGALLRVRSAFEAIIIAAGDLGAETALTGFLNGLAGVVRALANNAELLGAILTGVGAALGIKLIGGLLKAGSAMLGFSAATNGSVTALKGFKFALSTLGIAAVIQLIPSLINLFKEFNQEVATGVDTWTLFGRATLAVFKSLGRGEASFASFRKSINAEFADLAREVQEAGGKISQRFSKGFASQVSIDRAINGAALATDTGPAGTAAGKKFLDAFVREVQTFGGFDKFSAALDKIVGDFAPAIAQERAQAEALRTLAIAAQASDKQLKAFGLTKTKLAEITEKVKNAQIGETDEIKKALRAAEDQVALLKINVAQRETEAKVLEVLRQAKEKGQVVDEREIELLRERLTLVKQTEAQEKLRQEVTDQVASLEQEGRLLGVTEQQRRRIVALEALKSKAAKEGIKDITRETAALNAQFDALEQQEREFRRDAFGGARDGLRKFSEEAANLRGQFEGFTTNTLDSFFGRLSEGLTKGRLDFTGFVDDVLVQLQRIALNEIFTQVFSGASAGGGGGGGLFGGGGGGGIGAIFGSLFARGGVAGRGGQPALINASMFNSGHVRRFQRGGGVGFGSDNIPALLSPGEVVLTDNQADVLRRALQASNVGGLSPADRSSVPFGAGGDGRGIENNVTVVMQISTPDVASFQRSQQQIGAQTAASVNRALRRNG